MLHLEVEPNEPYCQPRTALLPAYLLPTLLLLVEVVHPLIGVHRRADANAARKKYHCLCLLGVSLEPYTIKEVAEGVKTLPNDARVMGHNKAANNIDMLVLGVAHY